MCLYINKIIIVIKFKLYIFTRLYDQYKIYKYTNTI